MVEHAARERTRAIGGTGGLGAVLATAAVALTDTGNLFGALEFSEKMASVGIQPIIGGTEEEAKKKNLKVGEKATVVYTPTKSGELKFACSMDMYKGTVTVQ